MKNPNGLLYAKSHEWVKDNGDGTYLLGLTDYAQNSLGDIVFINLPMEGDTFETEDTLGDIESVKAVSDIFAPVSCTVAAVNEELAEHPEQINQAPYETWLVKISGVSGLEALMDASDYEKLTEEA